MVLPVLDIPELYSRFDEPVTDFDCGLNCAPLNPKGIPFCCDICHAVPVAYKLEWNYLRDESEMWHEWRGDECPQDPCLPDQLRSHCPDHMTLLACRGPQHCDRSLRAFSCRQFPFFPYITASDRFIGLAPEWSFEKVCWVISHPTAVTPPFRRQFVTFYDHLLAIWPEDYEGYAAASEDMRDHFGARRRRIPLLHRDGSFCLLSPRSERLERVPVERMPRYGIYADGEPGTAG